MPLKRRVLIVEDEILVALELEAVLEDLGHEPIGIAADSLAALRLAEEEPDLALVDLNLRDGPTGAEIGARLARDHGVTVLFMTANPRMLGNGVAGTLGVLSKPYDEATVKAAVDYVIATRMTTNPLDVAAPGALRLFAAG